MTCPPRSEQGHCGSACSPLSRLAVTLLCTAGEVIQHEQQHLCVCYHCRTSSSLASSIPSFCKVNLNQCQFSVLPFSVAFYFVMVNMNVRAPELRAEEVEEEVMSNTLPSIWNYSRGTFEHIILSHSSAATLRMVILHTLGCQTTSERQKFF